MVVPIPFDKGIVYFEIIHPYYQDSSGVLGEATNEWMVFISTEETHLLRPKYLSEKGTKRTALFPDPQCALEAGIRFAEECGWARE